MKKVFIIHGFDSTPNGGWRAWLMGELALLDVYACALPMPDPAEPVLGRWMEEIARVVERAREDDLYLVGHSLGVPAILRYLENAPEGVRVAGAVLVSGPVEKISANPKVSGFLETPFDLAAIKAKIGTARVIHGEDDDRVPFRHAEILSAGLGAELVPVPRGGHLNGKSGWTKLPPCLDALKAMLA